MATLASLEVGTLVYGADVQWGRPGAQQSATIVRARSRDGAVGASVSWNDSPSPDAMAMTIRAWFAETLPGLDLGGYPDSARAAFNRAARNGTSPLAIAAVDNALWDLKAISEGRPLHDLWGSAHSSLPAYASSRAELGMTSTEEAIDHVLEARGVGFRGYKLHLWGEPERDVAACEAVRAALGDAFQLTLDPIGRWSVAATLAAAPRLRDAGFLWLEDPIPADCRAGYGLMAGRVDVPLAAADALLWSWNDYADEADQRRLAILRVDPGRQGITFSSRVVKLAAAADMRCECHGFGPEANSTAGLHVGLSQAAPSFYEHCFPRPDFEVPGIDAPTALTASGRVDAPTGPGLGLTWDWTWLEPRIRWTRPAGT